MAWSFKSPNLDASGFAPATAPAGTAEIAGAIRLNGEGLPADAKWFARLYDTDSDQTIDGAVTAEVFGADVDLSATFALPASAVGHWQLVVGWEDSAPGADDGRYVEATFANGATLFTVA